MRGFRVAAEASTGRHLVHTGAQIVLFWGTFLLVLPHVVQDLGHRLEEPALALPLAGPIAAILFASASALGLSSAWTMVVHGRGTPLPLATARRFVTSGPYRRVRNPMAAAGIAQGLAVGLWRDSPLVVLYALAGALLWHFVARPPEERDLLARFGSPYADYRAKVPMWLPQFGTTADGTAAAALLLGAALLPLTAGTLPTALARLAPAAALVLPALALLTRHRPGSPRRP